MAARTIILIIGGRLMDFTNIEKISPTYWRTNQLSIARHYGAIILQGRKYILCPVTDFLVREDIMEKELKSNKKLAAEVKAAEKAKWENIKKDMDLFA